MTFVSSGLESWAPEDELATEHQLVSTVAASFAAVEATKLESETMKRNADAALYGAAESNARFADLNETIMFVINKESYFILVRRNGRFDNLSEVNVMKDIDDSIEESLNFVDLY